MIINLLKQSKNLNIEYEKLFKKLIPTTNDQEEL